MGKSQRLRLSDVRGVFRILSDARDLRHDRIQQDTLIINSLSELLGNDFGYALQFEGFRPQATTRIKQFVRGDNWDPVATHFMSEWGKTSEFEEDPMMLATWDKTEPVYTTKRSMELSFEELRRYRIFEELVEPASISDTVFTFFRYPRSNRARMYIFPRKLPQKDYEARQLRIAHLFITELLRLYHEGRLEPRGPLNTLPPRLARIARQLMTDQNQRQIARSQNLSYHTVRSYTKELYDTMGVSSREALVTKLMGRRK